MSLILENLLQQLKAKITEQLRQGTSSCLRKRHPSCPAAVFGFPGAALEESHRNFLAAAGATCSGPEQPGRVTRLAKSARRGRLYSPLSRARAGVEARLASPLRVPPLTAAYSHCRAHLPAAVIARGARIGTEGAARPLQTWANA